MSEQCFAGGEPDAALACFELVPAMMAVYDGPDLVLRAVNAAGRAIVGERALLGLPARVSLADVAGQRLFERVEEVIATGEPFEAREWHFQTLTDGGEAFDFYADFSLVPRRAADGTVRGVVAYATDVTDRVRARQAVQARCAEPAERYGHAPEGVTALQSALLPPGVPVLPGVEIGAAYQLAEAGSAAGGDWFDAITLDGGAVALVVGDVVGHGVAAAAVMGQLRAVLGERLRAGNGPAAAVAALDRFAEQLPGAATATVCVAVLDPATGALRYCTAGHPPPLLVSPGGQTRYLSCSGGGALVTGSSPAEAADVVARGELLLLYTDGIVERPGRDAARSTVELARVATDATTGRVLPTDDGTPAAVRVCAQTLELLTRLTGHIDDITLLAAHLADPVADLRVDLVAEPAAVSTARRVLGGWLAPLHADAAAVSAVQHAVGEVVSNAVEHAYPDRPQGSQPILLRAGLSATGDLWVTVTDHGRWQPPRPDLRYRGAGLTVAADLVRDLTIDRTEAGTVVRIAEPLRRPVSPGTGGAVAGPHPGPGSGEPPFVAALAAEDLVAPLVVQGPVDLVSAPALRAELLRATNSGTVSRTVDLTGVTYLGSVGVHALHEALDRNATHGERLRLVAPAGTPAQHVLALVALPHDCDR